MRIIIQDIQKTPEAFQELHGKGTFLGSSEIATVCGLNRYQTPLQLWMRKTGRDTSDTGNWHTKLGTLMEKVVAELFAEEKKEWVATKNNSVYQHRDIDFATCTPDYFLQYPINVDAEALLEIKTSGQWAKKDWEESIPDYAHIQLQWQLGITELYQGYLAALIGGKDFFVKEVPFNKDVFSQLAEMGEKFISLVKSDTPPEANFADDLSFIKPTSKEIELVDSREAIEQFLALQQEKKALDDLVKLKTQAMDTIKNQIIQKLGDAGVGKCSDFIVYRKVIEMKESLRKAHTQIRFSVKDLRVK